MDYKKIPIDYKGSSAEGIVTKHSEDTSFTKFVEMYDNILAGDFKKVEFDYKGSSAEGIVTKHSGETELTKFVEMYDNMTTIIKMTQYLLANQDRMADYLKRTDVNSQENVTGLAKIVQDGQKTSEHPEDFFESLDMASLKKLINEQYQDPYVVMEDETDGQYAVAEDNKREK